MTQDTTQLDQQDLMMAADKVQKFIIDTAPNPGDSLGITATILVNLIASGLACGALTEETYEVIMKAIRSGVSDTFAAINEGLAAEAASETIQ